MLTLKVGLWVLVNLVFLSEVNLVHWFFLLALEGLLKGTDLIVLVHGVTGQQVLVKTGAKLVVGVHVNFFLQLSSDIFIFIIVA